MIKKSIFYKQLFKTVFLGVIPPELHKLTEFTIDDKVYTVLKSDKKQFYQYQLAISENGEEAREVGDIIGSYRHRNGKKENYVLQIKYKPENFADKRAFKKLRDIALEEEINSGTTAIVSLAKKNISPYSQHNGFELIKKGKNFDMIRREL